MSVHSHTAARQDLAAAPEFPRHVVTAVLVSHDGGRWLPDALAEVPVVRARHRNNAALLGAARDVFRLAGVPTTSEER